jgi:O-antigen ligase
MIEPRANSTASISAVLDPSRSADADGLRALDHVLFLPVILLVCAMHWQLRLLGAAFIAVPLALLVYAMARRCPPPRALTFLIGFNVLVAAASYFRLLPESWPLFYVPEAILRQLVPLLSFFASAWAATAYFTQRIAEGAPARDQSLVLWASLGLSPFVMYLLGDLSYEGRGTALTIVYSYAQFPNGIIIAFVYMLGCLFSAAYGPLARLGVVGYIVVCSAFIGVLQFRVFAFYIFGVLARIPAGGVLLVYLAGLAAVYLAGLHFVGELYKIDPNIAIRILFLRDALEVVRDTAGLGVGYGTESVRWHYDFDGVAELEFLPSGEIGSTELLRAMSTGVHNSFLQSLMRTGVFGLVLMVAAFAAAYPARSVPSSTQKQCSAIFFSCLLVCLVNPALETPLQAIGVGFAYGYLVAINRAAGPTRARGTSGLVA